VEQVAREPKEAVVVHGDIPSDLSHPVLVRVGRQARDVDLSCRHVHEEADVVRHKPALRPDLGGKEVCRGEDVDARAKELLPGRGGLSLRRRREAVALEDVRGGLVAHGVLKSMQRADDPVVRLKIRTRLFENPFL